MKKILLALTFFTIVSAGCSVAAVSDFILLNDENNQPVNKTGQEPFVTQTTSATPELRDIAALYFKLFEATLKATSDGNVNTSDMQYLIGPAMLLIPAFTGITKIPGELAQLTDEQINQMLLIASDYDLDSYEAKAKQILKVLLVAAQTYFTFLNGLTN